MSTETHVMLLCGTPALVGFLILHFATRKHAGSSREVSFLRAVAFVVAALLLIVLPLALWINSFHPTHANHGHPITPGAVFIVVGYLDAVFLWLIWNINSFACQPVAVSETPWDQHWGSTYSSELKAHLLTTLFDQMDKDGKIGGVVVDVGSGAQPVSGLLPSDAARKFILVDIAGTNEVSAQTQFLRLNVDKIAYPKLLSYRKALVRASRFFSVDVRSSEAKPPITTVMFSDILNYVDFRKVIRGFARFLQPGGRIIIVNLPSRGIREEFSEKGLKSNGDLYPLLEELNLAIEYKDFPRRSEGETEESEELIVLVAKKAEP